MWNFHESPPLSLSYWSTWLKDDPLGSNGAIQGIVGAIWEQKYLEGGFSRKIKIEIPLGGVSKYKYQLE